MSAAPAPCTAVIADDEPWLRAELRDRLAACWPELTIVAEAADGLEAVQAVQSHACDVVFLDVQMPRLNGLDAAARLKGSVDIVFLTAYDQYALNAFTHRAADYLLKPVDPERLADTVTRLRTRHRERQLATDVSRQLQAIAGAMRPPVAAQERYDWIKVVVGNATRLIPLADVMAFRAVTGYTEVVTAGNDALIRTPLRDLLPRLDPGIFVQVHRNAIVNLGAIELARRLPDGRYVVDLRHGRGSIETSRSRAGLFREE